MAIAETASVKKYLRLKLLIELPSEGDLPQVLIRLKRSAKMLINNAKEHMKKPSG
jgi:hypothetical protein